MVSSIIEKLAEVKGHESRLREVWSSSIHEIVNMTDDEQYKMYNRRVMLKVTYHNLSVLLGTYFRDKFKISSSLDDVIPEIIETLLLSNQPKEVLERIHLKERIEFTNKTDR